MGGTTPLHDVTCLLGFEPLTQARRDSIEAAGARAVMTYGFSEGGTVGHQCRCPSAPDDVHLADDAFAVIPGEAPPWDGPPGTPLLLTSLRPTAPKVLLNTDIGDTGVLETRVCGCLFEVLGYHRHLHTIRSGHKLTGEGVTFLGPDLAHVLETVLPRRFGGAPTDYQILEREDAAGLTRYRLLVSPNLGTLDERAVVETFLGALARQRPPYRFMVEQWRRTGALTVERQRPVRTPSGKLLAFWSLRTR
jgi:phenylacetate-coenzyme A ligase PaaK-like adenylate-forming protein